MEFCSKRNQKKKYQNNCLLNNEKSKDQRDKSVRVVTSLNDSDNVDQCSNSIFSTTQNKEQLYDKNVKCHDIKTMIINRGTKLTKGTYLNNVQVFIQLNTCLCYIIVIL